MFDNFACQKETDWFIIYVNVFVHTNRITKGWPHLHRVLEVLQTFDQITI